MRCESLTGKAKALTDSLVSNPQERWVGGAIGQATTVMERNNVNKRRIDFLVSLFVQVVKDSPKEVAGAFRAELAGKVRKGRLHKKYRDLLSQSISKLIKDEETVRHAFVWIAYKHETFPDFSEYDAKWLKNYLLNWQAEARSET